MKIRWILFSGLCLFVLISWFCFFNLGGCNSRDLIPSRDAEEGFEWEVVSGHGFRFLAQGNDEVGLVEVEDGFAIQNGEMVELRPVIEVYRKHWWDSPAKTIGEKFISALTVEQQKGCGVVPYVDGDFVCTDSVERFVIVPVSDEYRKMAEKKRKTFPDFEPCGAYGVTNGVQYFEYHDARPSRLLFVRVGQVVPLFDEDSFVVK